MNRLASKAVKKAVGFAGRKLLILLAPFIPVIFVFFMAFFLVALLVATVYGSMAPQHAMTGVEKLPEKDQEILEHYKRLCNSYNLIDTWLVSGESSPDNPHYPGKGTQIREMVDRYRNDYKLRLQWPMVHAVGLYWAFTKGKEKIPAEMRDDFAKDLRPFYYYKESEIITHSKDSEGKSQTDRTVVYLLVEANTISGHYQYHYEWVTDGNENHNVSYERLKDTQQILPNRWQRLEDYMKKTYQLRDDDDMELNRNFVLQAAEGFDKQKEWMDWLIKKVGFAGFVSSSMIPPELFPLFQEAEDTYGVPWWFLAAVAMKESTFNPQAENTTSHCYGLMQLSPNNWDHYSQYLGFDPVLDKDNPRAQIMCGAYMLAELGLKNVDWDDDWKEDSLGVLAFYGGYRGNNAEERCRKEYASVIWDIAEGFVNYGDALWPVPGYTNISSYFGWRGNPFDKDSDDDEEEYHGGIDIPAPTGTDVISVSGGTVYIVSYDNLNGNMIKIRDAMHQYAYCHLSSTNVKVGDVVTPGQKIGEVGNTGRSTGSHLHFEVVELMTHNRLDPLLLLKR